MKSRIENQLITRRAWLGQSSLLTLSAFAAASLNDLATVQAAEPRSIFLQPLGQALPEADVAMVERALASFYGFKTGILPRVQLPKQAYYPARARYRAEKLLDFLAPHLPEGGFRILGLTAVDISTTKPPHEDWGIVGLATIDGTACVISSFRCRRGVRDALTARQRLGKVAVHEIGHTLGLPHCPNVGCLMEDAQGSVATTDREYDLCTDCRGKLARAGFSLPELKDVPWPKPG